MTQDNVRVAPAWDRPDQQVLQRFREHSVANLGDALDRLNIVDGGISPVWHGAKAVGTALPVLTVAGDNKAVIAALDHIRPGDILVINAFGYDGRAIIGDNLAQRFDVFGAVGAVVDGYVRDGAIVEKLGVPVFARGLTPAGPFKNGPGTIGEPVALGGVVVNPGDIVVADDDGVIVIPPHRAEEALTAVEAIVAREADLDAEVAELRSRIA
ncbi:RraA family protein [Streptomyces phaeochromogenes]|uniref:Putative 4-hydroxy-4-methyl-2-oxoglutarate aldolase n=1 Tax=Streptomyces phaeochromogenes TaxID=1923 RepID=A0ABZ1H7Q8_STRPH|nr:aldolase [Streptomyces phaeochromogenes]MCX5600304.1 RraA family protein [Streptomyces phaeochromogenes]WRZ28021.1 RraA family protein [Streptomyces phaeochromogenes]WSD13586.1 RraA family protein [Streptomyces phaeochromogenes]WSJ09416.1 RraA family protein [Streptomyces phaeochromogenes]